MIREVSMACVLILLFGCGGGGGGGGGGDSRQAVLAVSAQTVVSTNGNLLKYVGGWSSCTLRSDGQFDGNHISFAFDGTDLLFEPVIGIVGTFSDAACTQGVVGEIIGVTPIVPQHISAVTTVAIASQSGQRFTGTADQLPDLVNPSFRFAGFSTDYKSVWFSSTNAFDGVVIHYYKN